MHVFIWNPRHVCRWFLRGFGAAGFCKGHSIPPVYSKPGCLITGSHHHSASVPRQLSVGLKEETPALVNRELPRQTDTDYDFTVVHRSSLSTGCWGIFKNTPTPCSFFFSHMPPDTGEIVFQKNIIPIKHKAVLPENKDLHCSGF